MNKLMLLALPLLIFAGLGFGPSTAAAQQKISVYGDKWYPYNTDPQSPKPGYVVEMLRAIYGAQHLTLDYQELPWTRCVALANNGTINAGLGALKSSDKSLLYPAEPCGGCIMTIYTLAGSAWHFNGVPSLASTNLACIADYNYTPEIDAYLLQNKGDSTKVTVISGDGALTQAIHMLQKGRVGAVVEDKNVFSAQLDTLGLKASDFSGTPAGPVVYCYIAFSPVRPDSKTYAAMWDQGVQRMRKDGTLAALLAKYNVSDWVRP